MSASGTNSGPEIHLTLTADGGAPLRAQVEAALRDAVRDGRLRPGQRLPASRVLAADLGVSRRLVVEAYTQLVAEGYLTARQGSATRVSDVAATTAAPITPGPAVPVPRRWDMRPGQPAISHFPRRAWRRAWLTALAEAGNADFGYPHAAGHPRLRAVLAAYLGRVRGVAATPESTLVCAGVMHALDLLCRVLGRRGARVIALEDPGLHQRAPLIAHAGLRPLPIPVDGDGLVVDALPEHGVDAVIVNPAHQFPTGVVLAPHRREALVAWASRTGALVIEDDYDGEFRFDRRAVGSLQGRASASVVYLGSVSKTLAPALRLGWIVCEPRLADELRHSRFLIDRGNPTLEQLALAELIDSGAYDRHIRHSRARYRENRQALDAAITRYRLPLHLSGIPAGVQTLATLTDDHDADLVRERAARVGVHLESLTTFQAAPAHPARDLVLGYGNITPGGIDQAMAALAELLRPRTFDSH
ncbi:MocR-like pyridoxine biosynthesis transcription factor PdxR [Nocardia mexicana]|uniref:GntR family transcriptional regulator/MocR family aminotransferase n=1 Tax=Nocardia mexicana TaxID=279262 RepID=A0A370H0R6_9NOCA|nr:PLP-dependent aminotransferase family protein [Nocardia mexicana]RDI49093.1 GntR family transcriptional regulator/MocR family aminotransferase [Nocardia mexicana]